MGEHLIRIYLGGNAWCAVREDFVDLAVSDAGFGDTPDGAVLDLLGKAPANPASAGDLVHVSAVRVVAEDAARLSGLLRAVAVALGQPDQPSADLPASVEALRLQRDRLQAAAQEALAIGNRP